MATTYTDISVPSVSNPDAVISNPTETIPRGDLQATVPRIPESKPGGTVQIVATATENQNSSSKGSSLSY